MRKFYPTLEELVARADQINSADEPVLEVHRSLWSIMSNTVFLLVSMIAVAVINVYYADVNLIGFLRTDWNISPRWLAVIPLIALAEIVRKYHDDLYLFTITHVTVKSGRLSLTYSVPNVRYVDIRIIEVEQDLMGRIFNYGDIELNTAAQDSFEVLIQGVRSPRELALLVEALRQWNLKESAETSEDGQVPTELIHE